MQSSSFSLGKVPPWTVADSSSPEELPHFLFVLAVAKPLRSVTPTLRGHMLMPC